MRLESDRTPPELGLHPDTCSLCKKRYSVYTSDPTSEVHLTARDEARLERYRFGTRMADFLLCRSCGVLVAAYMHEPPLAVVNVNVLEAREAFLANQLQIADLDGKSLEDRLARRCAKWTSVRSSPSAAARPPDRVPVLSRLVYGKRKMAHRP